MIQAVNKDRLLCKAVKYNMDMGATKEKAVLDTEYLVKASRSVDISKEDKTLIHMGNNVYTSGNAGFNNACRECIEELADDTDLSNYIVLKELKA